MNRRCIVPWIGISLLLVIVMPVTADPLIINHTTIDATKVPDPWITAIKSDTKGIDYAYTSHGLYIIGGLAGWDCIRCEICVCYCRWGDLPSGNVLKIGNRNNYDYWSDYVNDTPAILGSGTFRYSMFEWCTELSTWSTAEVDAYLAQMEAFEAAYPDVRFIYTTGHADASAPDGGSQLITNNARIRAYCIAHNKTLYDYEDIGSHSPDGTDYLNNGCGIGLVNGYADECTYNGGNWCNSWLAANPPSVFRQVADNCQDCCYHSPGGLQGAMKAGAFWWMMARLEGWEGPTLQGASGTITVTPTPTRTGTPEKNTRVQEGDPLSGVRIYPSDYIWNVPVDTLPVDAHSSEYINSSNPSAFLYMWDSFPFNVVTESTPKQYLNSIQYPEYSDNIPYPIPDNVTVQEPPDRHLLIVDRDTDYLYEMDNARKNPDGRWDAEVAVSFDLSNYTLRKAPGVSADAAGLPIFPGLVRYEEVESGSINHALRFTINKLRNTYIWPGRGAAGSTDPDPSLPPHGQRFRLKASFNISGYNSQEKVILEALKKVRGDRQTGMGGMHPDSIFVLLRTAGGMLISGRYI